MSNSKGYNPTGDAGVLLAGMRVTRDLKWIFRGQFPADYGIDAHIETTDDTGVPNGKLIGAQIKSGPSWFGERTAEGFIYRGDAQHLAYWSNHSLPVVLLLCDLQAEIVYWEHVTDATVEGTGAGWKILVPFENILNPDALEQLKALTGPTGYQSRLNRLTVDRRLIEQALRDGEVPIECIVGGEEEVIHITLFSNKRDRVVSVFDYPDDPLEETLERLFPWATVELDEVMYEDEDLLRHSEECALRDSSFEAPYGYTQEFDEWRDDQAAIRAHNTDRDGDRYSLRLLPNKLARAFACLDDYLREESDQPELQTEITD